MRKITTVLLKIFFLLVNLLFIYKYGSRQSFVPIYFILLAYSIFIFPFLYKNPLENAFTKKINFKPLYLVLCVLVPIVIFLVLLFIDENSLNVDRWSAMHFAIKTWLNGGYPYSAIDHLGGRTSNFPGLLFLGLPFYLLGNVGYLQIFAFLLLAYTLYCCFEIRKALWILLLLLFSPAYWWEIFAISDLMSNIVVLLCFILLLGFKFKDNLFKRPVVLGIAVSVILLTRGIVLIPLALLLFGDFFKEKLSTKLKFVSSFSITSFFLVGLVLINCPDWQTFIRYNPFSLQTSLLPPYVYIVALVLPFFLSFKVKKFSTDYFLVSLVLMLFPILVAFGLMWTKFEFKELIFESRFDISYLSLVLPFVLIAIAKEMHVE